MRRLCALFLLCAAAALAQLDSDASRLRGMPPCTATRTTNCIPTLGGALGTPSSLTLTHATGLPLATGVTGTLAVTNLPYIFYPASDGSSAYEFRKADGTTAVLDVDTTLNSIWIKSSGGPSTIYYYIGAATGLKVVYTSTNASGDWTVNSANDTNSGSWANMLTVKRAGNLQVQAGGSATKIVCWKADGKTLGYATMSAGDISACN